MIGLADSFILASAKLRAKWLLLVSTIIVSGLLFAALFAAIIIFSGVSKSVNDFTHMTLNGEYLVKSTPVIPQSASVPSRINPSDEVVKELNALQADYIASQKVLAAQLKIPFDPNTVAQIVVPDPYANKSLPESSRVMINTDSPVFQQYLQKLQQDYVKVAKNKLSDLRSVAGRYGASDYHHNINASVSFQTMTYLKNGKEDISWLNQSSPANSDLSVDGYLTSSVANSQYSFINDSFIQRFILPANNKRKTQNATAIPVVITAKEAVDLFGSQLGLAHKPTGAAQQVAWIKDLQQKLNGEVYATCYRNQADSAAITKAAQMLTDIEANKDNKAYVAPSLIYNLPTKPCDGLTVKKDTRTAAEKDQSAQQDVVSKALGTYQQPVRQLIRFQIVGVMPTAPTTGTTTDVSSFISELLGAKYDAGAIIPTGMYDELPASVQHKNILQDDGSRSLYNMDTLQKAGIGETIVTLKSLDDARAFIKNEGCAPTQDNCNRPFILEPYGTNYLLTNNLQTAIKTILLYAFVGVISVAIIIVWFMMSRVIADSRRETAIFRAIGAKRRDIVSIYLIYSSRVALRIVLFAVLLGCMAALLVQSIFESTVTDYARASYGIFDQTNKFNLMSFDSLLLPCLVLCILVVCLVAVLPSLIRNVRRNPITDMRDE